VSTLISKATGNLTSASTWAVAEAGSGATKLIRTSTAAYSSTTAMSSPTFTVTNAAVIDGVLLWIKNNTATPTGTILVELQKGGVTQASVTFNKFDLPPTTHNWTTPHFFKFTSTATGDGGSNWTIRITLSTTSSVAMHVASGTTNDWTRALRTTTTAAPGPGDDLYICGELTNRISFTGNVSVGGSTITNASTTVGLFEGQRVVGYDTNSIHTITNITGTTITVTPVFTANGTGVFFGGSTGDDFTVTMDNTTAFTTITATGGSVNNASAVITGLSSTTGMVAGMAVASVTAQTTIAPGSKILSVDSSSQITMDRPAISTQSGGSTIAVYTALGSSYLNSTVQAGGGIGKRGKLEYGAAASTNYILRIRGDLNVWDGGTLNIGTTGTPIPRNSTAILEFEEHSADGDFGLSINDGGTFNAQGLSRTSGKNVVSCKLAANTATLLGLSSPISNSITNLATSANLGTFFDPTVNSLLNYNSNTFMNGYSTPSAATAEHYTGRVAATVSPANTTVTAWVWLARGTGTHNRYVRLKCGPDAPNNGFYADIDLQAGTIGTCTTQGSFATAISSSITPVGLGYLCSITGKSSSQNQSANVYIFAMSAPGTTSFLGDSTNSFVYYNLNVVEGTSVPIDLTVDTDTGWLSGDLIAIASTTRNNYECEPLRLNANAGASTLTPSMPVWAYHDGLSPVQAEVILLTRNVKIRSASVTGPIALMSYVMIDRYATADIDWVEFYYLGENANGKRGIDINATSTGAASPKTIHNCSIHDCEDYGVYLNTASASINTNFSNNVMWLLAMLTGPAVQTAAALSANDWTMSGNIVIRTIASNCFSMNDIGGVFTNNVAVGAASNGIALAEGSAVVGTFSGNVAHSCGSAPLTATFGVGGTVSDFTGWRCGSALTPSTGFHLFFDGGVLFGNSGSNITLNGAGDYRFRDYILNGEALYTTTAGISISAPARVVFEDCSLGATFGHTTADVQAGGYTIPDVVFKNCLFASATEFSTQVNIAYPNGYVSSAKHDQTAGSHKTWLTDGILQSDTSIYRSASPSLRITPATSAVNYRKTAIGTWATGSTTMTIAYGLSELALGQFIYGGAAGFGIITDITGSVVTLDRLTSGSGSDVTLHIQNKMPSAPTGQGMKLAVNNGQTKTVSVYVRKQQENLLNHSEDFSQGVWNANNATRTAGQTDWLGGTTATEFLETASGSSSSHGLQRNTTTIENSTVHTLSFYIKTIGRQWVRVGDNGRYSYFDLTNGVLGTINAAHTADIESVGGGWHFISITFTSNVAAWTATVYTTTADGNSGAFTGDVTKGFLIGATQLVRGATLHPYYKTDASASYAYNGNQPRLIQRANAALGIAEDVVLDALTGSNFGQWEHLSATTTAPSGDVGVIELVVDCDGTLGWINVDDWSVAA
jgi:hypothetical protein